MKFNSNSVIMDGGCQVKFDVYIPAALLDIEISNDVWQKAINEFNKKLDARSSVTTEINGVKVDILKVELLKEPPLTYVFAPDAIILLVVIKEEDISKIADVYLCLTGHLTFDLDSGKVDDMIIKNITYGNKKFCILNDSNNDIR